MALTPNYRTCYEDKVFVVTIGGHLGAIWGPFKAIRRPQSKTLGANLRPISTLSLSQSGLKYPHIMHIGTDYENKVLVGIDGGHWQPLAAI